MKRLYVLSVLALLLAGCNSEPSLQKYFVEKTENKDFLVLDVSPSILNLNPQKLSAEQKQALETFDKMNILAFKLNDSNRNAYEAERTKVTQILKDAKYQQLMKFGKGKDVASVSFVGDQNHIQEFVVYANRRESGFAVVRILGDDMNPTGVLNIMSALKESNVDMSQLKPLQDMMNKK